MLANTFRITAMAVFFLTAACSDQTDEQTTGAAPQAEPEQAEPEQAAVDFSGAAFLAEMAATEGVVARPSGLLYKVLSEGNGPSPTLADRVTVHYRGTTVDGNQFDSSYDRGAPATFPLNGLIKGWQEGIPLMREGAKYEFYIPADLAYGSQTKAGGKIPANSMLIFEIELLKIG